MATGWNSYGSGSAAICKLPGCSRPRYKEPYGFTHDFCGRTHAEMFRKMCTSSGQGGHFTDGSRKPFSSSPASSTTGRQPLKAVHNFSTPSHIGSLSSSSREIRFYNRDEPYYEFTNFYRAPIQVDGHTWPTTEHYFQAQKFVGTPYVDAVRKLPSARDAFQFSRDPKVSRWRRSDWESVKDDVMLKALHMKFRQHEKLRRKLLETGEKKLIEHTSNDSYWGDGGNGSGRNMLGKLLMQVRRDLRAKYGSVTSVVAPRSSSLRRSGSFSDGISSHRSHFSAPAKDDSALLSTSLTAPLSHRKRSASHSDLTNTGSTFGPSLSRPSASELGYHTTSYHATSYQPQSSSKTNKVASTLSKYHPPSSPYSRLSSLASDDSALLSYAPIAPLSSRKRSASHSSLANIGTTSHHTSHHTQSSKSKNKGTSASFPSQPTLSQYHLKQSSFHHHSEPSTSLPSPPTSSSYKPKPIASLPSPPTSKPPPYPPTSKLPLYPPTSKPPPYPPTSSSYKPKYITSPPSPHTSLHYQPSFPTSSSSKSGSKPYKRPLPADPPRSSPSSASTGRRHTNQSSVSYNILTGR